MSTSKKYLILGPINQWGGVNIDVGFIAQSLTKAQHQVKILSYGKYFKDTSLLEFIDKESYTSVDRIIEKSNYIVRASLFILKLFKPLPIPLHHRLDNGLTKRLVNLKILRYDILEENIKQSDAIVILSQLTGTWSKEIVTIAHKHNKPVFYRVTQQIAQRHLTPTNINWLSKVSCFMHHSVNNMEMVSDILKKSSHTCIDQCAYAETSFLKIAPLKKKVTNFYILSRLETTKRIAEIIESFMELSHPEIRLHVYGGGSLATSLQNMAISDNRIIFYGAVPLKDIAQAHGNNDCLIINSSIEGGPYTAIEAMAAGKLIISTDVGAMRIRLGNNYPYILGDSKNETLLQALEAIIAMEAAEVEQWSISNRDIYRNKYSVSKIEEAYIEAMRTVRV